MWMVHNFKTGDGKIASADNDDRARVEQLNFESWERECLMDEQLEKVRLERNLS